MPRGERGEGSTRCLVPSLAKGTRYSLADLVAAKVVSRLFDAGLQPAVIRQAMAALGQNVRALRTAHLLVANGPKPRVLLARTERALAARLPRAGRNGGLLRVVNVGAELRAIERRLAQR